MKLTLNIKINKDKLLDVIEDHFHEFVDFTPEIIDREFKPKTMWSFSKQELIDL